MPRLSPDVVDDLNEAVTSSWRAIDPMLPARAAGTSAGVLIREARPDDLDAAAELEMGVIRHDAHVGTAIIRPATEALVREDTRKVLTEWPGWDTGRCGPSGKHARPSHWAAIANVSSDKH